MAVYAAFLSGGSQIGPVIAGYLIQAEGWRWFFILCAIIAAVNLVATVFLLPETLYEVEPELEVVNDIEKDVSSHVETVTRSETRTEARVSMDYVAYWKDLWSFNISKEAKQKGIFKHFCYLFILPFPLLLIPGVLIASAMYGVILGA
jgi:MFS family permease